MAEKQVNLAQGYGSPAYEKYESAQKALETMLAERENRLFDPTLLAMAQGFLAPTKTGSFGESLGNVAGAVAPVQQAEDKRNMDMARMRLEMAQQGVQTDIGIKKQQGLMQTLKDNTADTAPATPSAPSAVQGATAAGASVTPQAGVSAPSQLPAAAPSAPPVAGGLPTATPAQATAPAPVAGGLPSAPAPVQAPPAQAPQTQAPQAPAQAGFSGGYPLGMPGSQQGGAKGYNWNKQEADYFKLGIGENKAATDLIKDINEMRAKDTVWKEGYGVHIPSNTVYPIPSADQVEIQLPGDKAPRKVFKSDSIALQHYAATNDPRYREVLDRMKFGPAFMRQPVVPTASGATPPPPVAAPTTTDVAAEKARVEAEGSAAGTSAGKRTGAAMDKYEQAMESKNAAISIKELVSQPGADLTMGVLEKPTVKAAIAGMVASGKGIFDEDKFRDAYTKLGIKYNVPRQEGEKTSDYEKRKQEIYDRGREIASQAAMLQFQTSMLAKGQGAISNNERQLFADTTIGVKDSVSTINKKADMIIARSDFAKTVSDTINEKNMSLDQFKRTPEYKKLESDYENTLRNIWNPNRNKSQGTQKSGSPDLDAARARLAEKLK
jgi:hypothetical protein